MTRSSYLFIPRLKFSWLTIYLVGFVSVYYTRTYVYDFLGQQRGKLSLSFASEFKFSPGDVIDGEVELVLRSECECRKHEEILVAKDKAGKYLSVYLSDLKTKRVRSLAPAMKRSDFMRLNFTCNLYNVLRRGPGQQVIGLALYGQTRNYYYYNRLKDIARQIDTLYNRKWTSRVYYDKSINESIICQMECLQDETDQRYLDNVDFCDVNNMYMTYQSYLDKKPNLDASYVHAMMWRWFPIGDSYVNAFSSRDSDSYVLQREVDSVAEWFKSNKSGHIMRDHKDHGAVILGGMWGYRSDYNREMARSILQFILDPNVARNYNPNRNSPHPKGQDQFFLHSYVYNRIRPDSVIHDSHLCLLYRDSTPWPSKRQGNCYVGLVEPCDVNKRFQFDCPVECRPNDHKDWETC